jgi:hypothetical protein
VSWGCDGEEGHGTHGVTSLVKEMHLAGKVEGKVAQAGKRDCTGA